MEDHGLLRRRRLPHWDLPGATYFITTCLAGSILAQCLLDLARYRARIAKKPRPTGSSSQQWKMACWKRTFSRCDRWLDRHPAVRYLADPALAGIVRDTIYHWAARRYDLLAYVVMPSHLHWVFRPLLPPDDVGQVADLPDPRAHPASSTAAANQPPAAGNRAGTGGVIGGAPRRVQPAALDFPDCLDMAAVTFSWFFSWRAPPWAAREWGTAFPGHRRWRGPAANRSRSTRTRRQGAGWPSRCRPDR